MKTNLERKTAPVNAVKHIYSVCLCLLVHPQRSQLSRRARPHSCLARAFPLRRAPAASAAATWRVTASLDENRMAAASTVWAALEPKPV